MMLGTTNIKVKKWRRRYMNYMKNLMNHHHHHHHHVHERLGVFPVP